MTEVKQPSPPLNANSAFDSMIHESYEYKMKFISEFCDMVDHQLNGQVKKMEEDIEALQSELKRHYLYVERLGQLVNLNMIQNEVKSINREDTRPELRTNWD